MASETPLVVAAARQLPGVLEADVGRDATGRVVEVRVRLAPGARWAEVQPAVRRLVQAGDPTWTDLPVVLVDDGPEPAALLVGRPRVARLDVSTVGRQVSVLVELTAGQRSVTGRCSALASGTGLPRAVATATLRALQELLGDAAQLELEHVEVAGAAVVPLALVQLGLVGSGGVQLLSGSALVRHDPSDAVVRAVLDATNRRVEALLSATA